jgi:cupin 2 domain-containing protein
MRLVQGPSADDYMTVRVGNIFAGVSAAAGKENFLTLFESNAVKIERIVSQSHSSPPGFWYDQSEEEWVILVRGQATLEFADGKLVELKEGDYLAIPPHAKHRVQQTAPETVWLAVHVK